MKENILKNSYFNFQKYMKIEIKNSVNGYNIRLDTTKRVSRVKDRRSYTQCSRKKKHVESIFIDSMFGDEIN